jgi:pilus assembly protein CpaB
MARRKILLVLAAVIAAFGTLLVFLYVQSADSRAREKLDTVDVLVASQDIRTGESFEDASGKFELRPVPRDQLLANHQTSLDGLDGLVALNPIYAGEQIVSQKWGGSADVTSTVLAIPQKKVAISVQLSDPARVAGFVNPGSEVAIMLVMSDGQYVRTLLPRITVIGVGSSSTVTQTTTTTEGETTAETIPKTLMTLAVTQREAEKLLWGSSYGQLAFALTTEESVVRKSGPVTEQNLFQ